MTVAAREWPKREAPHPSTEADHRVLANIDRRLRAQPTVLRTYVPASMLPRYLALASTCDYLLFVDWRLTTEGFVRLVFCRQQLVEDFAGPDPAAGALAPTGTD
jgi:hypothetical protein